MTLVGLIGKKRAGKDTVAATLVDEFGFERVAFADPLKSIALLLDPIISVDRIEPYGEQVSRLSDVVRFGGWEAAKEVPEVRRTLQRLGVAVRSEDEDFWLRLGVRAATRSRAPGVVVTDVRFPNEAHKILELGGTLVRVVRPGLPDGDTHTSETALDGFDTAWNLMNDDSIEVLSARVRRLASSLLPRQPHPV